MVFASHTSECENRFLPNITSDKMTGKQFGKPHLNSMKILKYLLNKGVYLALDINK
jgi:hypothetical protein